MKMSLGYLFSESLESPGVTPGREPRISRPLTLLFLGIGLLFLLLGRLVQLQVVQGKENRLRSETNRIVVEKIPAPRGAILDRNGAALTRNVPEGDKIRREYIYGPAAAHVVGFVGEDGGKAGAEQEFDRLLTGKDGGKIVEQEANGNFIRELKQVEPVAGQDVKLTIDIKLQEKAYQAIAGKKGAIIVTKPKTGEILALVSSPSFDPNNVVEALDDPDKPMFNRATMGLYPPGSVFKIITATAALEEGKIDEKTEIEDTGEIKVGEFRYGNWYFDQYGKLEGKLNIVGALKRSNDIFFYKAGEIVGPEKIAFWAEKFGLGQDLGVVPSPKWKEQELGERWFLGNTYHLAIGQGNLQVTPMQLHRAVEIIANGGKQLRLKPETVELITEGMKQACSEGGTGFPFFGFIPSVACKTGTAQFNDPGGRTHAWFTAFDVEKKEVLVTVLLEAGGEGSRDAGPVAKEIMNYAL